jgi:hypothetical protein
MMRSPSQCPASTVEGREGPVVDVQHRLLEPRPPALLTLVCSAVIPTGAER